ALFRPFLRSMHQEWPEPLLPADSTDYDQQHVTKADGIVPDPPDKAGAASMRRRRCRRATVVFPQYEDERLNESVPASSTASDFSPFDDDDDGHLLGRQRE